MGKIRFCQCNKLAKLRIFFVRNYITAILCHIHFWHSFLSTTPRDYCIPALHSTFLTTRNSRSKYAKVHLTFVIEYSTWCKNKLPFTSEHIKCILHHKWDDVKNTKNYRIYSVKYIYIYIYIYIAR